MCLFNIKFYLLLTPSFPVFIACGFPGSAEVLIVPVKHHYKNFFLTDI